MVNNMAGKRTIVCGVGINDADYETSPRVNGKQVICNFYKVWVSMLQRCYDADRQKNSPSYVGCSVSEEWHSFMRFKCWAESQNWEGNELDKDILFFGNKVYSSETCVFVDYVTNNFTTDRSADRGKWPLGVSTVLGSGKFRARCNNPFTKKSEFLGSFAFPSEAHTAWKKRKHELALRLADLQTDERVAQALRVRYL